MGKGLTKVVKTEPDRPVRPDKPGTEPVPGSEDPKNRAAIEPVRKPENRSRTGKTGVRPVVRLDRILILNFS